MHQMSQSGLYIYTQYITSFISKHNILRDNSLIFCRVITSLVSTASLFLCIAKLVHFLYSVQNRNIRSIVYIPKICTRLQLPTSTCMQLQGYTGISCIEGSKGFFSIVVAYTSVQQCSVQFFNICLQ